MSHRLTAAGAALCAALGTPFPGMPCDGLTLGLMTIPSLILDNRYRVIGTIPPRAPTEYRYERNISCPNDQAASCTGDDECLAVEVYDLVDGGTGTTWLCRARPTS